MTPIGVTIISPSYAKVGRVAVDRFKHYTGLEVLIHETADGNEAFSAKLQLDRIAVRRPFVFFDSDLWFLDRPEFQFGHPVMMCCHDSAAFNPHAFPHTDCERFGMSKTEYFNSGLMVLDTRHEMHRRLFQEARHLHKRAHRKKAIKPADVTDQIWLNLAKHNLKLPWARLPSAFNFYLFEAFWGQQLSVPRHIIGLHGAGINAKQKFRKLTEQARVFEHPVCDIHPEVAAFEVARISQLR